MMIRVLVILFTLTNFYISSFNYNLLESLNNKDISECYINHQYLEELFTLSKANNNIQELPNNLKMLNRNYTKLTNIHPYNYPLLRYTATTLFNENVINQEELLSDNRIFCGATDHALQYLLDNKQNLNAIHQRIKQNAEDIIYINGLTEEHFRPQSRYDYSPEIKDSALTYKKILQLMNACLYRESQNQDYVALYHGQTYSAAVYMDLLEILYQAKMGKKSHFIRVPGETHKNYEADLFVNLSLIENLLVKNRPIECSLDYFLTNQQGYLFDPAKGVNILKDICNFLDFKISDNKINQLQNDLEELVQTLLQEPGGQLIQIFVPKDKDLFVTEDSWGEKIRFTEQSTLRSMQLNNIDFKKIDSLRQTHNIEIRVPYSIVINNQNTSFKIYKYSIKSFSLMKKYKKRLRKIVQNYFESLNTEES